MERWNSMKPICTAVIVAAGKGKRMGTEISKQFLPLCGKEILAHTVEKFERHMQNRAGRRQIVK